MVTKVGNMSVYCNGKIFVGPDWKSLFVSFLLIFLPSLLYLVLIAVEMGPDIFWFGFLLVVFNLTMLGLTGLSNPGIIPRRPAPGGSNAHIPSNRTKDYKINGYTISTKYCTTCQIYRVPRCSHCAMSDNCVEKFDHYCPWVGTCIGRRNYRFFLMFVFSGTALCLLVCATSLSRLVEISGDNDDEFDTALRREPIAIVLVIYTFGAIWFVGGLSAFHTYLVLTNQTTYEHIRRRFGQHGNPYNKGILMNLFEACCQPNPPYDWENGGSQIQTTQESSRNMELPAGVVLNPTVIAMRQAAKEEAERAQRASSNRGSDVGSCSYNANALHDNPTFVNEYQESLCSSISSVEGRQLGMTSQQLHPALSSLVPPNTIAHKQSKSEPEIAQEDTVAERGEGSSASLDHHASSRHSLTDSGSRRLSISGTMALGGKASLRSAVSPDNRQRGRHPTVRGDSANTSVSRYSENEMAVLKPAKRTGNPFELQPEDPDLGQADVATTLSSLTSNTTSEVSSHRTDRSDYHARKQAQMQKNRKRVLSMQEIMSSQTNIPDLNVSRKHSAQQQSRRGSSADSTARKRLFGSDSLARLRTLRASGENMFNHLRAKMKRQSRGSEDLQEHKAEVDTTEPVFINIDESADDSGTKQAQRATEQHQPTQDRVQDEGHGLRAWVPQLSPLTQQKYTELKEIQSPFDGDPNEDTSSHDMFPTESAPSANNPTLDDPAEIMAAVEPHLSRLPKHGGDEDVESLL